VAVVPSSVDTDLYVPAPRPPRMRPVIGWTGSSTSQQHLEAFAPRLRALVADLDVEVHVHSDRRPDLGIPFSWRPWSAKDEVGALQEFDIGIMPVTDDAFAAGKGAMKALLCMAVGVPVVCSAIEASEELIDNGVNGFLARSEPDWALALRALVMDADLRRQIGSAARKTVERAYSARHASGLFAAALRRCVGP
jgi:glycosyltransferase involved in cell wall biosynthesis